MSFYLVDSDKMTHGNGKWSHTFRPVTLLEGCTGAEWLTLATVSVLKHVCAANFEDLTKFASFRMEYRDTSRAVYAKATVRWICSAGLMQSSACYMLHDHTS